MNTKYTIIIAVLVIGAGVLLWPRQQPTSIEPSPAGEFSAGVNSAKPVMPVSPPPGTANSSSNEVEVRVPEYLEIPLAPELPPEQTVEWQTTRQMAMIKALQHHLEALQAKLGEANDPTQKQSIEEQIQILRTELIHQQATLQKLQE